MSKLTTLHINIIGFVVSLILAITLFFVLIKPKNELLDLKTGEVKSTQDAGGTAEQVKKKEGERKKEIATSNRIKADWSRDSVYYMPRLNLGTKAEPLNNYEFAVYRNERGEDKGIKDIPTEWGRWVEKWYDAQARDGVTRGITQFPVDAFPTDPNAFITKIQPPGQVSRLVFPDENKPWQVEVIAKDFDSAMRHLQQFNRMKGHGMPVINNVSLEGQSPFLSMKYDLALYVIPGLDPPPIDSRIGTSAGGAGGGGGGGGRPPFGGGGPPAGYAPSGPRGAAGGSKGGD